MTWVAIGTTVVVGTTLYSGYQAKKSADSSSKLQEAQGQLLYDESLVQAVLIKDDGQRFKQEQMMSYVGAGVEIQGTPLLLLKETQKASEFEAAQTVKRGKAQMDLANANAKITRAEGKAKLIASIGNAVSGGISTYSAAKGK